MNQDDDHAVIEGISIPHPGMTEWKRMESALRENTEQLRLFIEYAPAALAMFDTDMRYLSVSRRWLSDYGLGERKLIGESHYDIFPEIPKEWREAHRRGLAGEVLRAGGDRFERADGSVQWVRWEIRPWHDAEGKVGGIVIFTEDITEIKRAEEELRRYELLAGHTRDIILLVRRDDGRILEANAAAVNTYGYTREELLGLTVRELRAPETVELTAGQMAEADTSGILFDTVHLRRDGTTFPVEVSSQGATIGGTRTLVSVIRDITKRKQAEQASQESESRYRNLFENMLDGFAYCRMLFDDLDRPADFVYLEVNSSFGRLTGLEDVKGKKVTEVIPGIKESNPELFEIYGRVAMTGQTKKFEIEVKPLGIWLSIAAYSPERGYFAAVFENITERKRAEDELRASEEKFSTMLHTVPIAIALATLPDGALYNVNPAWLDLTGIASKEDAIGKTSLELGLIGDAAQRESILNEFRQNGFARNVELTFCTRKGLQRTVFVNLDKVEIGGRTFILSTMEETTERKRAEEELLHKNRMLESMAIELSLAEECERDRIAGELHDQVGQRLIFGKMKLGALASQLRNDTCLSDIEELDKIIDLSIQDIRTLTFQLRPPLLASAGLEAALCWLGEEFSEKYGQLLTYSDDGQQKPMRYEARSTVFQAAREMLLNTVKHADATQIGIKIWREADTLRVCVSDNGRGFDLAEARKKKSKSGGFGLINVQRRIEYLGGSLTVESGPGNGTCVTIMAPLDISRQGQ